MRKTPLRSNPAVTRAWQQRSRKPLPRVGKKTDAWEKVRRQLKPKFERMGITTCELQYPGCWRDNALGFAHAKKRRHIGPGELSVVILTCQKCHSDIEILPHEEMHRRVMEVIRNRASQLTSIPESAWKF